MSTHPTPEHSALNKVAEDGYSDLVRSLEDENNALRAANRDAMICKITFDESPRPYAIRVPADIASDHDKVAELIVRDHKEVAKLVAEKTVPTLTAEIAQWKDTAEKDRAQNVDYVNQVAALALALRPFVNYARLHGAVTLMGHNGAKINYTDWLHAEAALSGQPEATPHADTARLDWLSDLANFPKISTGPNRFLSAQNQAYFWDDHSTLREAIDAAREKGAAIPLAAIAQKGQP